MLALLTTSLGVKLLRRFDASSFGASWPYSELDLARMDPSPDIQFYETPRFVTHIDDGAIRALTDFYRQELTSGADVLDLCSSWISHLPDELALGRVAGVGMNARELERNERLTEFAQRDLNVEPVLPYDDASFDFVCNVVSVDYLCRPQEIFAEMHRVLRPGGKALMSFSNRCFPSKAVKMWLYADDATRMEIVASYYNFAPQGGWDNIEAYDIKKGGDGAAPDALADPLGFLGALFGSVGGDPMFVVTGTKR